MHPRLRFGCSRVPRLHHTPRVVFLSAECGGTKEYPEALSSNRENMLGRAVRSPLRHPDGTRCESLRSYCFVQACFKICTNRSSRQHFLFLGPSVFLRALPIGLILSAARLRVCAAVGIFMRLNDAAMVRRREISSVSGMFGIQVLGLPTDRPLRRQLTGKIDCALFACPCGCWTEPQSNADSLAFQI